ncbi:MAG: hypothetical protein QOF13_1833 [Solirubrobacterales bacterium]|nr:hypothetical protein [Solirubrobacterales bacterium]
MFSGGFKRSSLFGLIGVFVVAAVVAAIALSTGEGQGNPKTTYALIFGVLAVFMVILFALQRSDMERAAGGDAKAVARAVAEGGGTIENPTTMEEQQLWAALAVKPIDDEAIKARGSMWDAGRRSLWLGMIVTLLIFLTVPSIYLFESFVPLVIGGPLIAIAALYGSIRALAPGGEMDSGYEKVGLAMAPLGFEVTERPKVNIEVREATTGRVGPKIHGALVLNGERHGRAVSVRLDSGEVSTRSEVTVRVATPDFKAKSRDGRVRPGDDTPVTISAVLEDVPNSTRWKKLTVEGGPEGVIITRKGTAQADWLCDLWLAERLADAA